MFNIGSAGVQARMLKTNEHLDALKSMYDICRGFGKFGAISVEVFLVGGL
jgi:hypothetical protein